MTTINLSLNNTELYKGCEINEVGGRLNLLTNPAEATNIIGRNIAEIVKSTTDRAEVTLTGAMAVWAYLIVFHAVVHSFNKVYYSDGKSEPILISQHGA